MKPSAVCRKLVTRWRSWTVTAPTGLRLDLPKYDSTDMTGCIEVAKFLMPEVTVIHVYAGGVSDVLYKLTNKNDPPEWEAFDTRPMGL